MDGAPHHIERRTEVNDYPFVNPGYWKMFSTFRFAGRDAEGLMMFQASWMRHTHTWHVTDATFWSRDG